MTKKIPFFVRKHATTKAIEKIANEHPEFYIIAKKEDKMPVDVEEKLRRKITELFRERMEKHNIA